MEKYYDVIERTMELLETINEGLLYTEKQIEELRYEGTFELLKDSKVAIESIEKALAPLKSEFTKNSIDELYNNMIDSFNEIIENFEENKKMEIGIQIKEEVVPEFGEWKEEIIRILNPFILS